MKFKKLNLATIVAAGAVSIFSLGCNSGHDDIAATAVCPNLATATGVIGQPDFVTGTSNTNGISASNLNGPLGSIATDGTVFYIADTSNNRVLGYSSLPVATNGAARPADFAIGQTDLIHNDVGGGTSGLARPAKVSISSDGVKLVVTDSGNNRVLIWNTLPMVNVAPDVVVGQTAFVDAQGKPIGSVNGGGQGPAASTLSNPTAAIIVSGELIIVDKGNNRVLIWNTAPTTNGASADLELGQVATDSTKGACSTNTGATGYCFTTNIGDIDKAQTVGAPYDLRLNQPSDVWTDGINGFVVSDTSNNRVLYWNNIPNANNSFPAFEVGQVASMGGNSGFGQNSLGTTQQKLASPWGVSSDGSRLFVADFGNNRVVVFTGIPLVQSAPLASGVFGQGNFTLNAYNDADQNGQPGDQRNNNSVSTPTSGTLFAPTGVFSTNSGKLYVSDRSNNRVLQFDSSSAVNGTRTNLCAK